MAFSINVEGATIRKPGVYPILRVDTAGGFPLAPTGIVAIIGEAIAGPPASEDDVVSNFFTPEQASDFIEKYKSGPLVDAFNILKNPSNDNRIVNGAQLIYAIKTNASKQSSATLFKGVLSYGDLLSKSYGLPENGIKYQVEDVDTEVGPIVSNLSWLPNGDNGDAIYMGIRVNGGATQSSGAVAGDSRPDAVKTTLNGAFTGVTVTGATDRGTVGAIITVDTMPVDGQSFTLDSGAGAITFEFDNNASVVEGPALRRVDITGLTTVDEIAAQIVVAIGGSALAATATVDSAATSSVIIVSNSNSFINVSVAGAPTMSDDSGTVTLAVSSGGRGITLTHSNKWANTPSVGDTLYIALTSILADDGVVANSNIGGYIVTSATSSVIVADKLASYLDVDCEAVAAKAVSTGSNVFFECYAPMVFIYDGTTPDGQGASVEFYDADPTGTNRPLLEHVYGGESVDMLNSIKVSDGSTLALDASAGGGVVSISVNTAFLSTPDAGDVVVITSDSPLSGASNENVGFYRVTSSDAQNITATKSSGAPASVTASDIAAIRNLVVFGGILSSAVAPILKTSSQEATTMITVTRDFDGRIEESDVLGGTIAMLIGYDGTTASLTINASKLTTTVVGGTGANLDLKLSDFDTIQDLANYINNSTGYSATVPTPPYGALPPSTLDRVSGIGIAEEFAGTKPGRIKRDSYEVLNFFSNQSTLISLELAADGYAGLPTSMTNPVYLTGAERGGTTAASISDGLDELEKVKVNSIVPLFSRDAVNDILDGDTEPSSNYKISAVNTAVRSHVKFMSNTKNRKYRNGFCSYKGSFADSIVEANSLNSEYISLAIQDVRAQKEDGTIDWVGPWGLAAFAAGMQAGARVGEPFTFKYILTSGVRHDDFDPQKDGDVALANGIMYAEQPLGRSGIRFVLDNTTYNNDANFVFNRSSVLFAGHVVADNMIQQLEAQFIGRPNTVADATAVYNFVVALMGRFLAAGIIVGDDLNGGKGFRDLSVRLEGNKICIDIKVTLVQGVEFIIPTITLTQAVQSVS